MRPRTMLSAALFGAALLCATPSARAQVGYPVQIPVRQSYPIQVPVQQSYPIQVPVQQSFPIQVPVQQPIPLNSTFPGGPLQPGFVPSNAYRQHQHSEVFQVVYRPGPRAPWQTYGVFPTMRQAKSVAWALRDRGFQARIWD